MKTIVISFLLICLILPTKAQSNKELKYQIYKLEKEISETSKIREGNKALIIENERLKSEIENLKSDNKRLTTEVSWYKPANAINTSPPETKEPSAEKPSTEKPNTVKGQCNAITAAGSQCQRNASEGSEYCWQHQGKQTEKPDGIYDSGTTKINKSSGSSSESGRTIQTGSRGGKYYINKNGNKTYIKK